MSQDTSIEPSDDHNPLAIPPSERDYRQGLPSARVVLVEYGDYQCPTCGELHALIKAVQTQLDTNLAEENYLCFVFRQFPQPQIHPHAQKAAMAAAAAGAQGKFWQMHDMLFNHQQALEDCYLVEYANHLELDIPQFLRDISRRVHADRISQDLESGLLSGVTDAPALFINGTRYTSGWDMEQLMAAILT
ncbi:DsbA family protein [Cyanobacteria bacterium FACHB-471]|nr:DsbA family protein [Cyanobacteria bacterium FACHB-471]